MRKKSRLVYKFNGVNLHALKLNMISVKNFILKKYLMKNDLVQIFQVMLSGTIKWNIDWQVFYKILMAP